MEGERLSLSRFDFQKRDAWLVLDANASRSSAVVSQRSKTCREGKRQSGQRRGDRFPGGNVAPGSVNPGGRRRRRVAGNCLQGQESEAGMTFHWRKARCQKVDLINQSINRSVSQSIYQSVNQSNHQSVSRSINQSWCFKHRSDDNNRSL